MGVVVRSPRWPRSIEVCVRIERAGSGLPINATGTSNRFPVLAVDIAEVDGDPLYVMLVLCDSLGADADVIVACSTPAITTAAPTTWNFDAWNLIAAGE